MEEKTYEYESEYQDVETIFDDDKIDAELGYPEEQEYYEY